MGVGGFNTFLMAKYAGAFKEVYAARKHYSSSPAAAHSQPQNNNVDPSSVVVAPVPCEHVFVDLNSVLHIALRRASTEAEFVQELFYQLDDIARVVTPIKTLVLAADARRVVCLECEPHIWWLLSVDARAAPERDVRDAASIAREPSTRSGARATRRRATSSGFRSRRR